MRQLSSSCRRVCSLASVVSDSVLPCGLLPSVLPSVPGILQARILGWVAMPSSRGCFQPRGQTQIFIVLVHAKLLQSCPTLCSPVDCSLPNSSVHGILQARIQEWVAMPSSRGIFPTMDGTCVCVSCTGRQVLYH